MAALSSPSSSTATPSEGSTSSEHVVTSSSSPPTKNQQSAEKQQRTRQIDYVDLSKHLMNDPMTDLLTDTHITNFLEICVDFFNGHSSGKFKKFQFVNPTFFESPYQIEDVTNFVTDFDPDICVLFIPVCYNTHWVLFVLRPKTWTLEIHNSLEHIYIPTIYRTKVSAVCAYLFKCTRSLRVSPIKLPKCLQQKDGFNCGVFLCVYIEQIIRYGKICDVIRFNIEEERLRLDWIFYEVKNTLGKPLYWPPFSGEPILTSDSSASSSSSSSQQSEDSKDDEVKTSEEDNKDDKKVTTAAAPIIDEYVEEVFE